jgi:CRP-like cAMP-binding protein
VTVRFIFPDLLASRVWGYVGQAEAEDETERLGNDPALTQVGAHDVLASHIDSRNGGSSSGTLINQLLAIYVHLLTIFLLAFNLNSIDTPPLSTQGPPFGVRDLNIPGPLHDQLALGRSKLSAIFGSSPPRTLKAGELLAATGSSDRIYRFRTGWACQFRDLANGRRAILDVYLPGDVIGLDTGVHPRPLEEIHTLTAATIEAVPVDGALIELMADRPTALYVVFLLGQRQRRADRLLTAISCLDARGRLAMMLLDFYTRLRRRKLISGSTYNLPLTQVQIGNYLGLTVVHINRVLRALRGERVVDLEKHCVTILDLKQLGHLARNGGTAASLAVSHEGGLNEAAD